MKSMKVIAVMAVMFAVFHVSVSAVYGLGNVMYRRYPNGPTEFHRMPVTRFQPEIGTRFGFSPEAPVARTNVDNSWMFSNDVPQRAVPRPIYFG
ncbi:hypothetical protein SK128_008180 [Halocaridina rubra]|uniref:Uncharacterized protein n=1 Tax=Halocaridina rubra TaxID=373956 RepID=A0AAN8ZXM0_HALRR